MGEPSVVAALHALTTCAMFGLIWFVQIVHYPLFELADRERFARFAARHQRLTTWVVVPLMLVELLCAALLLLPTSGVDRRLALLGLVLLAMIWTSTSMLQVPSHRRLSAGFDANEARRLVKTNWIRTLAWTARAPIAIGLLAKESL